MDPTAAFGDLMGLFGKVGFKIGQRAGGLDILGEFVPNQKNQKQSLYKDTDKQDEVKTSSLSG